MLPSAQTCFICGGNIICTLQTITTIILTSRDLLVLCTNYTSSMHHCTIWLSPIDVYSSRLSSSMYQVYHTTSICIPAVDNSYKDLVRELGSH